MTHILAGVFAICTAACAFDQTGSPNASAAPDAQASVSPPPDAAPPHSIDAAPPAPPDACVGKRCDGGGGPGPD